MFISSEMARNWEAYLQDEIKKTNGGQIQKEVETIRDFLKGAVSSTEAATQLGSGFTTKDSTYNVWSFVGQISSKYPEHHEALLKLVAAIYQLPEVVDQNGQVTLQLSDHSEMIGAVWGDLTEDRNWETYYDNHVNSIAFLAKMSSLGIPSLNLADDCAQDFCMAFEQTPRDEASFKQEDIQALNINIPLVAQWVLNAGELIISLNRKIEPWPPNQKGLWTGPPEFCIARWEFWKSRAAWVQGLKSVHPKTRELARGVTEAMEKAEAAFYG
ncbi:unnamed protein product [Clonostachys chloroleuca]|uniref:Uncharacterized protein n=1 Tax=Clonostachys chloroleuca TaxID=1926264 RepID=A0AA35Q8R8_9HYPO|nr:unnamed protein product [Clonostachys chloroleuca]